MEKVIIVRYGEIILKGLNRKTFEDKLIKNIKNKIHQFGKIIIKKSQARIIIETLEEDYDFEAAVNELVKVLGIVSVSIAIRVPSEMNIISEVAIKLAGELKQEDNYPTFKVETKRGDKQFPLKSPEISAQIGGDILEAFDDLTVDVRNPSFVIYVEVRNSSYVYTKIIPGFCGLPAGTNGKALSLLSGGIDSPVASFMMAKRGVQIEAIHFYSYPYTSERAKDKVIKLTKIVSDYAGPIKLHIVPFTDIQLAINNACPQDMLTVIMRRVMMIISEKVARANGCLALITGESLGQVASQTIQALYVTDMVVDMPVFRPLIGMDKNEVIDISRKIDTYETSILPYEDCCTVFVAKHPKTKPTIEDALKAEENLHIDDLIDEAIKNIETIVIE